MSGSHRHAGFIEVQKELHPDRPCIELERSTDVRWSSKSGSVSKVLLLLDVILEVLADFSEACGQTKLEADALLQQIQNNTFLFLLVTFSKLFDTSDFATKGLQSSTLSVTDCIGLIEILKSSFSTFRDNSGGDFDKVLKLTEEMMIKHDISNWDVSASRQRKLPVKLADSVVTTSLGKTSSIKSDSDLRQLWNNILDRQITELNSRFQEDTYGIMQAAASFSKESQTCGLKEQLKTTCDHYAISIEDAEFTVFIQQLSRKMNMGKSDFSSIMSVLDSCPDDIFPNINSLLRIIVTLPMTSCSVERLFSTTTRIKNRLRTSMTSARLNHFSLLSFERELTDTLDYDEIITIFNSKPRRLRLVM